MIKLDLVLFMGIIALVIVIIFGAGVIIELEQLANDFEKDNKELDKSLDRLIANLQKTESELKESLERVSVLEKHSKDLNDQLWESNQEIKRLKNKPKPKPVSRGNTISRGKLIGTFNASAYTDNKRSQGKWVGQTATGVKPQVGVIAVDPNVIPLGTKLYVEGYGNCIAGDTGGAIKGNKIDLFMNTQAECTKFGRKNLKVYRRD